MPSTLACCGVSDCSRLIRSEISGRGDPARQHRYHSRPYVFHARRFRYEAGRAEFQRAPDRLGVVMCGYDHHRHRRMDAAQGNQPGKTARAGHGQIEQNEVDILIGRDQRLRRLEIPGLENRRDIGDAGQRLLQRAAKQGMVVRDDELVA
jgi:hypothetical protein